MKLSTHQTWTAEAAYRGLAFVCPPISEAARQRPGSQVSLVVEVANLPTI